MMIEIPFTEWLPDRGELGNPGIFYVQNMLPHVDGYAPLPTEDSFSAALSFRCRGAISLKDKDGAQYIYAGDESSLNVLSDASWTDVSATATTYTATSNEWEFAGWYNQVIATNYANTAQVMTLGGTQFVDLSGAPPKAKHIAVVRQFVVLGNINDPSDGVVPNRIHWSGFADETTWAVSATTQADREDLQGGGAVQRIFGGEYGVVLLENSVWRMSYVGTPVIWQLDEVLPGQGLIAPGLAAQLGDSIFFLSQRGFLQLTNGAGPAIPIGDKKVDQTVLADLDTGNLDRCSAVVDPKNTKIFFAYPGADSTGGMANRLLVYDYTIGKWSFSIQDIQILLAAGTGAYTLEGLDNISTSLDALPASLDSSLWTGSRLQIAKFDSANRLAVFTGSPMLGVIETGEMEISKGARTLVRSARPLVDADGSATITMALASRNKQSDTKVNEYTTYVSPESSGVYSLRSNARYHRMQIAILGDWTVAQGVQVEAVRVGGR